MLVDFLEAIPGGLDLYLGQKIPDIPEKFTLPNKQVFTFSHSLPLLIFKGIPSIQHIPNVPGLQLRPSLSLGMRHLRIRGIYLSQCSVPAATRSKREEERQYRSWPVGAQLLRTFSHGTRAASRRAQTLPMIPIKLAIAGIIFPSDFKYTP